MLAHCFSIVLQVCPLFLHSLLCFPVVSPWSSMVSPLSCMFARCFSIVFYVYPFLCHSLLCLPVISPWSSMVSPWSLSVAQGTQYTCINVKVICYAATQISHIARVFINIIFQSFAVIILSVRVCVRVVCEARCRFFYSALCHFRCVETFS